MAALDSYLIMDTDPEADFEDLTRMASEICDTPIALITLVDQNRQWFKSNIGLDVSETPREHAFCAHTIVNPSGTMQIQDARTDGRFANNPLVTAAPNIVFYAGVSLETPEGHNLGTLCVIDRVPKKLSDRQLQWLKILAKQVITQMELRKKLKNLVNSNRQLGETNEFMQRFATSAAHDLKNPLSSISMSAELLVRHLEKNGDDRGLKLASTNLTSSKTLAQLINDMLAYSLRPEILSNNHKEICLKPFLEQTIGMITMPNNVLITLPADPHQLTTSEIALKQIFINLLTNAVRYNDKKICKIDISSHIENGKNMITVQDNGIGIKHDDLERIFDRNVTLKRADRFSQSGTGIGLFTVRLLIDKLGGSIQVESEPLIGSKFIICLP